jgi:hypothetical protein
VCTPANLVNHSLRIFDPHFWLPAAEAGEPLLPDGLDVYELLGVDKEFRNDVMAHSPPLYTATERAIALLQARAQSKSDKWTDKAIAKAKLLVNFVDAQYGFYNRCECFFPYLCM